MSKKRNHGAAIQNAPINAIASDYRIYDNSADGLAKASAAFGQLTESYTGRVRASTRDYMGFDPTDVGNTNTRGRYGLNTEGYEAWRPGERSRFDNPKDTMLASDLCYKKHGLIRNIIDLMSDFGSQGIRLVHPNKRIEKFYQNWFLKVQGEERSERFLNNFYRLGNTVVRWQTAKIDISAEDRLYKTHASPDVEIERKKINKREIPWKYVFLHPVAVDVVGGALANFVGEPKYAIKLPLDLARIIKSPRNEAEKALVSKLPAEIIAAARSTKPIELPSEKTRVFSYKKDDWQEWGDPILASILIDISLYEKLKLADRAALDGAISNVRIFKIGSLEYKIIPGQAAADKLAEILESNTQAGTLELIWGPDIELIESQTNVHNFLGKEKYEPTLIAIYAGLGIPPTLTGTFGASGTTNNFISLKTLTQRLEYGRDVLTRFWNEQIRIVQEAMGFRFPAKVEFDFMNLGDDVAEKSLLIQLADRSLISDELLQRYFGHDPDMERTRINRENNDREAGRMIPKAGAFHDPMFEMALKKIFAQSGTVTPSELGIELLPRKSNQKPALEMRQPAVAPGTSTKPRGKAPVKKKPNSGRPKNTKDSGVRKTKTFKPKVKAATLEVWANDCQIAIAQIMNPILLEKFGKTNMRSLSNKESSQAELIKFGVLCNMEPFSSVTEDSISQALVQDIPMDMTSAYNQLVSNISNELNRPLTLEEQKRIQASIYVAFKGDIDGEDYN